jgi:hypothetical protein
MLARNTLKNMNM